MSLKIFLVTLLIVSFSYGEQRLRPLELLTNQIRDWTTAQYAKWISDNQPEIVKKAVLHYLNTRIEVLQKTKSSTSIKQQLRRWFSPEGIAQISRQVIKFMRDRLFDKLQMGQLSDSLKSEINDHPENYFLTFDMYDLLIDDQSKNL